jgi:hypothetical protein
MRYLIPAIVFILVSCGPSWKEVTPPLGTYMMYTTITVKKDWCYMDGVRVNGVIDYNTVVRSISRICVSLKSDDPERTLKHELDHAWRNALNLDAKWSGHP